MEGRERDRRGKKLQIRECCLTLSVPSPRWFRIELSLILNWSSQQTSIFPIDISTTPGSMTST